MNDIDVMFFRSTEFSQWTLLIQRMLNKIDFQKNGLLVEDGIYGNKTEDKVKRFQRWKGLMVDGIVGVQTFKVLLSSALNFGEEIEAETGRFLKEEDIVNAAVELDVDSATIKAVIEIEAAGEGFIKDKPTILFEGHVFWNQLKKHGVDPVEYREGYEDILYPSWTKKHYRGGVGEYDRLEKAKDINRELALESCSWGLFQIMGYHWKTLGYDSIDNFVASMYQSEGSQLFAFVKFVQSYGLVVHLQNKDWKKFARKYNGELFWKNNYDIKLKRAYKKYKQD